MISTQPFFIAGIDDPDHAKTSAFGAMGMFLFTFVASLIGIWYDSQYKAEPITGEGGGGGSNEDGYHLSTDNAPTYGTST